MSAVDRAISKRPLQLPAAVASFMLGACATVAVQSAASDDPPPATQASGAPVAAADATPGGAPVSAEVRALEDAPMHASPPGTATVQHLALGQNAYVGKLVMDPEAAVPVHRDPTEEFIHVLEGEGQITIDGSVHEVRAGSTIYMPANAEVSYQNGAETMVAIQVFAGPEPAKKYDAWPVVPKG